MTDRSTNRSLEDSIEARVRLVEDHVRFENEHDLEAVLGTYGPSGRYDDEPNDEHHVGPEAVRRYYEELLGAVPDLHIEITSRHATEETVVLEVIVSGTHLGPWRGLPATGRRVRFPLCAVYTFDGDKLAGEKIYYDRASVFQQVGVLHDPDSALGRSLTALTHPITMARALVRMARSRSRSG